MPMIKIYVRWIVSFYYVLKSAICWSKSQTVWQSVILLVELALLCVEMVKVGSRLRPD